jgi:protein TonB
MIFAENRLPRTSNSSLALSLATHGALFLIGFFALHARHVRPIFAESRCCSATLYWSPNSGISRPTVTAKPHQKRRAPLPVRKSQLVLASAPVATPEPAPPTNGQSTPQQLASMGVGDSSESAEPALPVYRPAPGVPDRSLLPDKEQNVVVEVEISALGDVTGEKLLHGLGNALDEIVLQTVKGWRFRPATLNGTAVASVEDLVFQFNHNYQPEQSPS